MGKESISSLTGLWIAGMVMVREVEGQESEVASVGTSMDDSVCGRPWVLTSMSVGFGQLVVMLLDECLKGEGALNGLVLELVPPESKEDTMKGSW